MSENTYLSGKTSTRDAVRRYRFNPMGIFTYQNAKCFSRAAGLNGAYSHSLRQHSENVIHAVSSGWFLPDSHLSPPSYLEDASSSDSQDYSNTQVFKVDPCFLRHASPDTRDAETGRALSRKLEWRESGSASSLIKSTSITSTSTDATVAPCYMHHIDPNMKQVSASSTSTRHVHLKSTRRRKRIVHLRPKFPKYEGLSGFAAPMNLLPSSPSLPTVSDGVSFNKSAKSAPGPSEPNAMPTNHIRLSSPRKDDAKDKASPAEKEPNLVTGTPVDFLKNLTDEAWVNRQQTLEKMAIERKKLLLTTGFSDASGKPFPPDEPSIEAKPIPNRWVWYMRLSMDYDKTHGTVVPSGGPAAYLKYGWDRMGKCGKKLYQELADAYSAQKVKHLATHTLNRSNGSNPEKDVIPKRLDHSSEQPANSPLPPGCNKHDDFKILGCGLTSMTPDFMAENACDENGRSASTTGLSDKFAYTDVFSSETCLSSYSSPGMASSETNASPESVQSISNTPLESSMSDGFLNLSTITDPFFSNGFDFSGFAPDFKNLLTQQGFERSTQQPILDQHVLEVSMNWPSTGLSSELALVGQSAGNYAGFDFSTSFGTNVPERFPTYLHAPVSGQSNSGDLLMVRPHNQGCRMQLGENTLRPAVPVNEPVGFSSWVTPTYVKEQCDLLGSNNVDMFDF